MTQRLAPTSTAKKRRDSLQRQQLVCRNTCVTATCGEKAIHLHDDEGEQVEHLQRQGLADPYAVKHQAAAADDDPHLYSVMQ